MGRGAVSAAWTQQIDQLGPPAPSWQKERLVEELAGVGAGGGGNGAGGVRGTARAAAAQGQH